MEINKLHITDKTVKNIKVKTVMTKKQFENIKKGTEHADAMSYKDIQDFIKRNHRLFIDNRDKKHQINILTAQGWRSGKAFLKLAMDFYDPKIFYNDDDDLLQVYGVQILEYP